MSDPLYSADVLRSLMAMADSWENDNLSVEDMCDQLEAMVSVAEGYTDYHQFISTTGLNGIQCA